MSNQVDANDQVLKIDAELEVEILRALATTTTAVGDRTLIRNRRKISSFLAHRIRGNAAETC